jgi:teichuronic acid exporter
MTQSDPLSGAEGEAEASFSGSAVVRSFAWQGAAVALGQAISWVSTIVVIRLLSPEDYGLMAMAGLFVGFLLLVSDLGVGAAAVQSRKMDAEQMRALFGFVLAANAALAALTLAAAPLVAAFFQEPRVVPLLRALAAGFALIALYVLPQALLMRDLQFDRKARADVLAAALGALVTLGMAIAGAGVWSLVGGLLATHAVRAIAFQLLCPYLRLPSFAFREHRGAFQFGGLITLDRMLWWSYGKIDIAIGGRFLGGAALGLYSVALSLASIPLEKVMPVVTQVSFAAFSRIQDDRDRVRRNVIRSVQSVSLVSFPAFVGMAAVAPEAVPLLLGDKWQEAVLPFQLLCAVLPLRALASLFPPALFGIGRPRVNVVNMLLTVVAMAAAFAVGVRHGVVGLCLAWVAAYPPAFALTSWRALRALEIPPSEVAAAGSFFLGASLVMGASLLGVRLLAPPSLGPLLLLAAMIATGVSVYAGLVLLFQRRVLREFAGLVRSR